jgi:16S rRNA (adenine1518-N6/adenine1519-N6)-dimethyltransferase
VGGRLLAAPGGKDYGVLSVLLACHFSIRRLFSLGPANFFPPPQVESLVLALAPASAWPPARDPALLAGVVKAAFGQRRKTLNNALAARAAKDNQVRKLADALVNIAEALGFNPEPYQRLLA